MMRSLNWLFRLTILACFVFVVVILCPLSKPVWAHQHALHILYEQPLALKLTPITASDQGFTHVVSASVLVRNDGPPLDTLTFSVVIPDDKDEAACVAKSGKPACITIPDPSDPKDKHIDAFAVKRFDLQLLITNPPESITGYLMVSADGGVVPGTMPVTLNKPVVSSFNSWLLLLTSFLSSLWFLANQLVLLSLGAAVILIGTAYGCVGNRPGCAERIDTEPKFSFEKSWTSTLTGLGALLLPGLTTGVLPEDPQILAKEEYTLLNLLFGGLVVLAGLFFAACQKPKRNGSNESGGSTISVRALLVAASITLWATFGELLTVVLLMGEMKLQGVVSGLIASLLLIMLIYACWRAIRYAYSNIQLTVTSAARTVDVPAATPPLPPVADTVDAFPAAASPPMAAAVSASGPMATLL